MSTPKFVITESAIGKVVLAAHRAHKLHGIIQVAQVKACEENPVVAMVLTDILRDATALCVRLDALKSVLI